ncbi:electron transport complex subunit RsxC [Psychromonas sp. MME1]|uniref:electron transport complex subunit RsxC n=1 Tax=Psychromonas sp. MME1 TaxID=3231032 RepID=UPI0034E19B9E
MVIATDGLDRHVNYERCEDYQAQANVQLIEKIYQAGIVGLGGAGFPTHLKLFHKEGIKLLIINAVECEPYITADDRLMQEHSDEIIKGIQILQHILKPTLTVIAIEDNKPQATLALNEAVQKVAVEQESNIIIRTIATRYPSGSEKQLIEIITGQQTPHDKHPTDLGIVMQNVGTVFAIKEAIIDGKPLISRIVTLTGDAFSQKGNLSVRIGTPIQYLLDRNKFDEKQAEQLIIGGPMMGFSISHSNIPVSKICNCILAATTKELPAPPPERACIRCGECAQVCPVQLLPQQLFWYAKSKDHGNLAEYNLSACIECGACAFVCPSNIPLVEYYRVAKAEIKTAKEEAQKSEKARLRFEKRAARLEQEKRDRQAKHKEAAQKRQQQLKQQNGGEDLIAAALARAKAKKEASNEGTEAPTGDTRKDAVAAAVARAKAKKEASNEGSATPTIDTRKDAVATAVARAKAKKEASNEGSATPTIDTRKDAVAAAVARAKAKKAASNEGSSTPTSDTRKDAVAAAVARAKAKKAANVEAASQDRNNSAVDEQQIIAQNQAAITARQQRKEQARLKKQQKQAEQSDQNMEPAIAPASSDEQESHAEKTPDDSRKAKIAAAIARAKAKKAAAEDL